jgi:hypothetical protein
VQYLIALPQGTTPGHYPKALPQGTTPRHSRHYPKALSQGTPKGTPPRHCPKALPQGTSPRQCPNALQCLVDLGQSRQLRLPPTKLEALLAAAPALPAGGLSAASFSEQLKAGQEGGEGEGDDAHFEGRALTLLNLVHHGSFGSSTDGEKTKHVGDEANKVLLTLAKVAQQEAVEEPIQPAVKPVITDTLNDPRDWNKRMDRISFGSPPHG